MSYSRDPCIKKHTAPKLRWFADQFRINAARHRIHADELEAKALRYEKRAQTLEVQS